MPNPLNVPITPPRVAFIDPRSGTVSREWYMFFLSLYQISGGSSVSLDDLQKGPPALTIDEVLHRIPSEFGVAPSQDAALELIAELQKTVQGLALLPRSELGTMSQLQQANLPWVTFDTTPEGVPSDVGTLAWDGGTTLGVQMTANVLGRVNESGYYYIKASSSITKGQVVMFTGAVGASGVPTGAPATGVTDGSYIMGIAAESLATNQFGLVQFIGTVRGVDTSAYADGDILWYNPAVTGGLTKTKPSAPNVKVQMAAVISASNNGTLLVRVTAGSELGGTDSNVQFGTLATNDLIQYNGTYWTNVTPSSVSIGTATNLAGGAAGSVPYQTAPGTTSMLSIGTAGQYLKVNSGATAPQWSSPAALTKTDDTNVTLTLGGSASTSLLNAASITVGWTGTLAVGRGGTGTGTAFTAGSVVFAGASGTYSQNNSKFFWDNTNNFLGIGTNAPGNVLDLGDATAGRALSWGGTAANYANIWTAYGSGNLTLGAGVLPTTSVSDSYLSSYSGSIARAAVRVNSTDGSFEVWNAAATTVARGSAVSLTKRFAINTSGQVTMDTVTTGVWNGTAIAVGYGGTGVSTTPTNGQLLIGNGTGYTVANLTAGSGVSISNSAGGISISATGTGGTVTSVSVVSANGFAGTVATATTTPAITLTTSVSGLLYGNGTALAAATISAPLTYSAGTLAITQATTSTNGYLSSTDWNTFNNKQAALVSGTNIKTVGGVSLLGSGDVGTLGVGYGGTGVSSASITAFNNITGYTATGATGTTSTNLVFSTSPTITTPTLAGDVSLSTGNITQGTAAKGVNFSANSTAAGKTSTLLNWYEEGTFTPTLAGSSTNPTVTYSIQRGRYTRVGRLVTIECYVAWSAISGGSGNIQIAGFPYTIDPSTGASGGGAVSYFDGFTLTAGRTSVGLLANANTKTASPTCMGSGVSTQYVPVSSVAAGLIIFTLTYSV
jgi:hypothetical protein